MTQLPAVADIFVHNIRYEDIFIFTSENPLRRAHETYGQCRTGIILIIYRNRIVGPKTRSCERSADRPDRRKTSSAISICFIRDAKP